MKTRVFAVFAATLAIGVDLPAGRAQVTVDLTKITCDQYLTFKVADPQNISIWLSGYFHGRRGLAEVDPQKMKENYARLKSACFLRTNMQRSIFEVAEKLFTEQN